MSLEEYRKAGSERMVQISKVIDENEEAARLQGAGLFGMLAGVWFSSALTETAAFDTYTAASLLTILGISALAIRAVT
jgi:hypothetical protein